MLLYLPVDAVAGGQLDVVVTVRNELDAHNLPTGSTYNRQLWVELLVHDSEGTLLYETGTLDANGDLRDHWSALDPYGDDDLITLHSDFIDVDGQRTRLTHEAVEHRTRALQPLHERTWTLFVPVPVMRSDRCRYRPACVSVLRAASVPPSRTGCSRPGHHGHRCRRRHRGASLRALLMGVLAGCGEESSESVPAVPAATVPQASVRDAAPDCADVASLAIEGRVRLRPVAGEGVPWTRPGGCCVRSAVLETAGAQVDVSDPARDVVTNVLVVRAQITECAKQSEAERCQARVITAPMAAAVDRLARPKVPGEVVVVALGQPISEDSPLRSLGLVMPGLSVIDGMGSGSGTVPSLAVAADHSPVLFIDVGTPRRPGDVGRPCPRRTRARAGLVPPRRRRVGPHAAGVDGQRCWPGISAGEGTPVEGDCAVYPDASQHRLRRKSRNTG